MKGLHLLKRLRESLVNDHRQVSYAQCGEDLILNLLFNQLDIRQPSYLDIGAHHPSYLSNTYFFYKKGSCGVCVEPNPSLHKVIQRQRPRDTCLNVGIGVGGAGTLRFYVLDEPVLSTFSETVMQEQVAAGQKVNAELNIALEPIDAIIEKYFDPHPNLLSLDTEGLDLAILQDLDFTKHRPDVFCVETLTNIGNRKLEEIIQFMLDQNYVIFADTFINTIFVEGALWKTRQEYSSRAST